MRRLIQSMIQLIGLLAQYGNCGLLWACPSGWDAYGDPRGYYVGFFLVSTVWLVNTKVRPRAEYDEDSRANAWVC